MYARSPRALGIQIRQIPRTHVAAIICVYSTDPRRCLPQVVRETRSSTQQETCKGSFNCKCRTTFGAGDHADYIQSKSIGNVFCMKYQE